VRCSTTIPVHSLWEEAMVFLWFQRSIF
jgi:hypothetical protein